MLLPADQSFKSMVLGVIKHLYYSAEGVTLEAIKGLYDGSIDAGFFLFILRIFFMLLFICLLI